MKFIILPFVLFAHLCLVNGFNESFANFESNVKNSRHHTINHLLVLLYKAFVASLSFASIIYEFQISAFSKGFEDYYWCYEPYPCLQIGGPFISVNHPISLPPYPPKLLGVKIELFTRGNPDAPFIFNDPNDISEINKSNFNSSAPTIFTIAGFTTGNGNNLLKPLVPPLLANSDCNIFNVNWEFGSVTTPSLATANTRLVGAITGRFIELLHNKTGLSYSQCHMIGHSLGAHISGYAGEYLKGQIGRISGLDPGGLYFNGTDPVVRLDPTDAQFVDVIHSNAGNTLQLGMPTNCTYKDESLNFGIDQAVGHVDVWPNGGRQQPNCSSGLTINLAEIYSDVSCSHGRSIDLYAESIPTDNSANCRFTSYPCSSYSDYECNRCFDDDTCEMGFNSYEYAETNAIPAPHNFYLDTNSASPYCTTNTVLKSC